ncbi:XRE family transcriptional regulator [Photobacterium profundum]|uniref:Putative transcriptional regulator n=1 Tax=Photobacterium profundum 3TCK TaxID=314280 RepID=Q1YWV9_9GAMM|nr:helix-turn-helix transcriptional regulator [Photobacterium profundum]EAS40743.1 putative transcriptional regulator [Photobacterium profundum 3TCK]PSV62477.1 XRE family transcriptional regulator [Photobacterium profundum]
MHTESPLPIRLKESRKTAGISQKELGIRLGMDPSSASGRMNHYEKGRHMPDIATLRRIADELGVPLSYFFCDSDNSAKLVRLIEKLSEEDKKELIRKLENDA